MKEVLVIEFKRLFKGNGLKIALLIGIVISVLHYIKNILPVRDILNDTLAFTELYPDKKINIISSVFYNWIGVDIRTQESFIFYILFPLLAVIPYGFTLYNDRKNGYIKTIYFRCERKKYLTAKYIVAFVSGFIVVTVPIILNFLLSIATIPDLNPEWVDMPVVYATTLFYDLFDKSPYLYTLIYIIIAGVFGGIYGTIAIAITNFVKYRVSTMIFPFLLHIFLFAFADLLGDYKLSPISLVNGGTSGNSLYIYAIYILVLFIIPASYYFFEGLKTDEF